MKRYILILLTIISICGEVMARDVYSLNNNWRFFFKEENSSDDARYVRLPHTWNLDALSGGGAYRQTVGNYEHSLFVPAEWQGKRLFLRFGGVQSVADVFVNGSHVGEHRGGWTAFTFEITDKVFFGSSNTLLVAVSNAFHNDVLPTSTEDNLYGGIYRDVELIVTGQTAISPLYYGTEGVMVHPSKVSSERAEGRVDVMLMGKKDGVCNVSLDVVSPDGYVAMSRTVKAKIDGKLLSVPFAVENPELWSPAMPRLYKVVVAAAGDTVSVTTGFRHVEVTPEGLFTLNGKRVPVRGVTLHHDRASSGSALKERHYDSDLRMIRSMGANALRSVTGPHAQSLYERCDRNGTLVWIDVPFTQSPFLSDIAYYQTARFEQNGREQLREIVLQNCNHPSVVMWGIFSLLRGSSKELLDYVRSLNDMAKSLDASRPTVACSNRDGEINFITDLIVWQQSIGWESGSVEDLTVWQQQLRDGWSHLRQAVCYGEGGTIGQSNEQHISRSRSSQHRIPESWQTLFHEGYLSRIDSSLFWGVWLNTMFDFGSARYRAGVRNSGLAAFDHAQCKDAYYLYKTVWNTASPTLYIVGKNRDVRMRDHYPVKVYSSQGRPTLTINGAPVEMKMLSQGVFSTDTLSLRGCNKICVSVADMRDSMVLTTGNYLKK